MDEVKPPADAPPLTYLALDPVLTRIEEQRPVTFFAIEEEPPAPDQPHEAERNTES